MSLNQRRPTGYRLPSCNGSKSTKSNCQYLAEKKDGSLTSVKLVSSSGSPYTEWFFLDSTGGATSLGIAFKGEKFDWDWAYTEIERN